MGKQITLPCGPRRRRIRATGRGPRPDLAKTIRHVGFAVDRCRTSNMERTWAESWIENNSRWDTLQALFERGDRNFSMFRARPRLLISRRDAFVAATVIQWLGTNVGFGFVCESLKKCGYKVERIQTAQPGEDNYYSTSDRRFPSAWQSIANSRAIWGGNDLPEVKSFSLPRRRFELAEKIGKRKPGTILARWLKNRKEAIHARLHGLPL